MEVVQLASVDRCASCQFLKAPLFWTPETRFLNLRFRATMELNRSRRPDIQWGRTCTLTSQLGDERTEGRPREVNGLSAVHGANGQVAELTRKHLDHSPQRFRLDLLFKEINGLQPATLVIAFLGSKILWTI